MPMRLLCAAAAAALALAALPTAPAQVPFTDIALEVDALAAPVPHDGSAALGFNVTVGCALLLSNGGTVTVTVSAPDAPAYLAVAPASVDVEPEAGCLTGAGSVVRPGSITLTPTAQAPGLADIALNLTATDGTASSEPSPATVQVSYRPGHRITPDVAFPAEVHGGPLTFNLTLEYTGNARSMIMFEQVESDRGAIAGFQPLIEDPPATRVIEITYTPPDGDWTTANVTFYNYSHFLLASGAAGTPQLEAYPVWTFVNAEDQDDGEGGGGKDSPAPAAALLALGLLAFAALRRRQA